MDDIVVDGHFPAVVETDRWTQIKTPMIGCQRLPMVGQIRLEFLIFLIYACSGR
ncbi:hypothetical protein [Sodalis-like endosymbiont of Proechinophthirus fluctus]|uniref:hypothetical protein n=1 Tax=Sodalis-like endosymbiont of Proechinophthirus fluctus TaxID=1462730 RepID=UPI000ACB1F7E